MLSLSFCVGLHTVANGWKCHHWTKFVTTYWINQHNMLYYRKGTIAHKGLTQLKGKHRKMPPCHRSKFRGGFFLCKKHYLINVKTNVSNARMNIPKAIRSLKSNGFLSISTTPILCNIKWRSSHPVTRLSLTAILTQISPSYNSYNRHIQFLFLSLNISVACSLWLPYKAN